MIFKDGDWVLLRFEKARLRKKKGKERLYPKLSHRFYGPFQILESINDVSYRLVLPDTWKINNAFRVSLLRPLKGEPPIDPIQEEQPEVEETEEILVPEQILSHKDRVTRGKTTRSYLVKFKDYSPMDAQWMTSGELQDSSDLVKLYDEAFVLTTI